MKAKTGNAESGKRYWRNGPGRKENELTTRENETGQLTGRTNGATQTGGNNQKSSEQKKKRAVRRDVKGATELGRQNGETKTGTPRPGTRNRKDIGAKTMGRVYTATKK